MISVKNITKNFGEKNVLNGLNLEIPRGETLVIMGRSGSGKSILPQNYHRAHPPPIPAKSGSTAQKSQN